MREWLVIESSAKHSVWASDDAKRPTGYVPRDAAEQLLGRDLSGTVWFTREESERLRQLPEWRHDLIEGQNSTGEMMTDIVERLRSTRWQGTAFINEALDAAVEIERLRSERDELYKDRAKSALEIERLRAHYADEQQRLFHYERIIAEQRNEVERLRSDVEQGARWRREGEAELRGEIERLREQGRGLAQSAMNNGQDLLLKEDEITRLRAELDEWRACPRYDPMMSGERRFKGWDRSQMDRCRKQFIEEQSLLLHSR